jgi:predicted nucleotidyltransferase
MRITTQQAETVRLFAHRHFGEDAVVWLFGSRANDAKKGGDYDFLVETSLDQPDSIIENKIPMIAELQSTASFEDEKIDLIVKRRNSSFDMPIYRAAKQEGIKL